ncbi:MAG TPA: ABC transporter ATP-binding protein [Acidimicrobiia bacterium]|nr:ABC transporter ATP-binding protein [Acidimicrobiia bacterium]
MGLLDATDIVVRFGGLQALDAASLTVEPGCVTGLIGPNGAGKTTLFNVITGLQRPTSGRVMLEDRDITGAKPHRRARLGVARTFQRLEAFGSLSARENVLVAAEMRRRWAKDSQSPAELTQETLELVGITAIADVIVDELPTGTARLVEVARALATKPRVLLLDEPSSGLDDDETDALGRLLLQLAERGLGILLVEHDMPFVMHTCIHIDVLDFGRIIATGNPTDIQGDAAVQAAYLGSGTGVTK